MKVKYLELQGFKTFPNKTKLQFKEGISVVVGPNGSGKSNVSDALRWVLGEQSIKNIRCLKMEDVIFAGSESRKPHGFASVTLAFDNQDGRLPYKDTEVAVTRRYYRSGESEYLINMRQVRLKDINELFMDTGVGRDGYSIVGQGKISAIVSAKPRERREIFEEAAGISGCRYRKEDAENKLKQASENLVRIKDILSELESRVGPLKKQSEKAKLYLKYAEEKKLSEISLWIYNLDKYKLEINEFKAKLDALQLQKSELDEKIEKVGSDIENSSHENNSCMAQIDGLRRSNQETESEISQSVNKIALLKSDIKHNEDTILKAIDETRQLESSLKDIENNLIYKNKVYESKKEEVQEKENQIKDSEIELQKLQLEIADYRSGVQSVYVKIEDLEKNKNDKHLKIMLLKNSIEEFNSQKSSINQSISDKSQSFDAIGQNIQELENKLCDLNEEFDALSSKRSEFENKLKLKKNKREDNVRKLKEAILENRNRENKIKILEDLENQMEGFSNSVRSVIKKSKSGELQGIVGTVSSILTTNPEYSVAIDIALGMSAQNIVTVSESDAKNAILFLKSGRLGRATFLPISSIKGNSLNVSGLASCPGFKGIASDVCTCDSKYAQVLNYLLGRVVIADNIDNAIAISKKFASKFKIVTMDGQVINAGGSLTGGSVSGKAGFISRISEINKLKSEKSKVDSELIVMRKHCDELGQELEQDEKILTEYKSKIQEMSLNKNELNIKISNLKQQESSNKKIMEELDSNVRDLLSKIASNEEDIKKYSQEIRSFDKELAALDIQRQEIEKSDDKFKQKNQTLLQKIPELKIELVSLQKELEIFAMEISSINNGKSEKNTRIQQLGQENERLQNLNESASKEITVLENSIQGLKKRKTESENKIENLKNKRENLERSSSELRKQEKELLSENQIIIKELSRLDERGINIQKEYDSIIAGLWDEYGMTLGEAKSVATEIKDINEEKKKLNTLKSNIKGLGEVNVASIEEYKEVNKRYCFMNEQVEDIEKSRRELNNVISGLDKDMRRIFLEKFNDINNYFSKIVNELFGGGAGKLMLENSEDVLESGINISVRVPGKNEIHLEALSGGERSLVAIALYFAIIKVNPPPFCLLDEIEAALDDVNVDRFAGYLRKICDKTQIIVITHRRGTMEEADVLYGVTMAQEGVSSLLELQVGEVMSKILGSVKKVIEGKSRV